MRTNTPLSILMIDIDFFKNYIDLFGHLKGDKCLKKIALEVKNSLLRPRDIAARFGGEEFVVVVPETGTEGAAYIAKRILSNIRSLSIDFPDYGINGILTVSVGSAAIYPKENLAMETLLKHSDQALYKAKNAGRNCLF